RHDDQQCSAQATHPIGRPFGSWTSVIERRDCLIAHLLHNVGPITGRAGTAAHSTDRKYTAGPVRCIGRLCSTPAPPRRLPKLTPQVSDEADTPSRGAPARDA